MHIDAGDYRRTDRTLSTSFFGFFKFIVVHNPCLQHPSDKSDNIGVFDPWSYKTYDPFMVKMLEEPFNVCIQYITCCFLSNIRFNFRIALWHPLLGRNPIIHHRIWVQTPLPVFCAVLPAPAYLHDNRYWAVASFHCPRYFHQPCWFWLIGLFL